MRIENWFQFSKNLKRRHSEPGRSWIRELYQGGIEASYVRGLESQLYHFNLYKKCQIRFSSFSNWSLFVTENILFVLKLFFGGFHVHFAPLYFPESSDLLLYPVLVSILLTCFSFTSMSTPWHVLLSPTVRIIPSLSFQAHKLVSSFFQLLGFLRLRSSSNVVWQMSNFCCWSTIQAVF